MDLRIRIDATDQGNPRVGWRVDQFDKERQLSFHELMANRLSDFQTYDECLAAARRGEVHEEIHRAVLQQVVNSLTVDDKDIYHIRDTDFKSIVFDRGVYSSLDFSVCDFRGAHISTNAVFQNATFSRCQFDSEDLRGVLLNGRDIRLKSGTTMVGYNERLGENLEIELYHSGSGCWRPYFQLGPIGSESGTLEVFLDDQLELWVARGCFDPSPIDDFIEAVRDRHGTSGMGRVYLDGAVKLVELWRDELLARDLRPQHRVIGSESDADAIREPDALDEVEIVSQKKEETNE